MPGRQGRGRRRSGGGHGGGPLRSFQGATWYTRTRGTPRHRPATRVRSAHRASRAARSADDPRITRSELTDGPNATPTEQKGQTDTNHRHSATRTLARTSHERPEWNAVGRATVADELRSRTIDTRSPLTAASCALS